MVLVNRQYDLPEIPEGQRVYSPDRRLVAAFWVSHHHEDRYENHTGYTIAVWEVATGRRIRIENRDEEDDYYGNTHEGERVSSIQFRKDGKALRINEEKEWIRLPVEYDEREWRTIPASAVSADGRKSAGFYQAERFDDERGRESIWEIVVWEPASELELLRVRRPKKPEGALTFSPDAAHLLVRYEDGTDERVVVPFKRTCDRYEDSPEQNRRVAPGGRLALSWYHAATGDHGEREDRVCTWDLTTGRKIDDWFFWEFSGGRVTGAEFSPDGKTVQVQTGKGHVRELGSPRLFPWPTDRELLSTGKFARAKDPKGKHVAVLHRWVDRQTWPCEMSRVVVFESKSKRAIAEFYVQYSDTVSFSKDGREVRAGRGVGIEATHRLDG